MFQGMSQLEHVNQRLTNQTFITHRADIDLYQALVREVYSLKRGDDKIEIPDVHSGGAWARLWAVREMLLRRPPPEYKGLMIPAYTGVGSSESAWSGFLANREQLASVVEKQRIDTDTLEFVGLQPGDLDEPIIKIGPENPTGRPEYWHERAQRISVAIGKLQSMSPIERALIPLVKRVVKLESLMSKENANGQG